MRVTIFFFVATLLLRAESAPAQDVSTKYFLSKSVVTVSGLVTTKATFPSDPAKGMIPGGSVETSQVAVTFTTVPDQSMPLVLLSGTALLSKNTVSIELTSSGMLAAVNAKSEGVLGTLVKNLFGAAVTIAKVAGGILMSTISDAEKKYATDHSSESARRESLKKAIQDATSKLIEVEAKAVAEDAEAPRKVLRERVEGLKQSLANLRAEWLLADAHYTAWKSRMEDAKDRRFEYVFDVDDLPGDDGVRSLSETAGPISVKQLQDAAGSLAKTAVDARILLTQGNVLAKNTEVKAGTASSAISFRTVRPVVLSIYLIDGTNKPVLSKRSLEFVTGSSSSVTSMPVHNAKWSTKSVGLTFSSGVLTKLTTETGSELAGATDAIRGLPAEYLGALKQANEIITENNKLSLSGVVAQIDELKKHKELIEARIASGEAADLATMQAETARLDAELKLLNSQRGFVAGQGIGADTSSLTLQVQLIKLQNDLAEAQVKQLNLQRELEELRRKAGGQ